EKVVEGDSGYAPGVLNLCRAYLRERRFVDALALLQKHRAALAGEPDFDRFLAQTRVIAGRGVLHAAAAQLERATSGPQNHSPLLRQFREEQSPRAPTDRRE